MDSLLYIAAAGVGLVVVVGLARAALRHRDSERRTAEREAYRRRQESERAERDDANVGAIVDRFFPFAKVAWSETSREAHPRERLRTALANTEGIVLGSADIGFDAVLVDSARRQHLLCLGKSGYGKSTIAARLIRDDLRRGRGVGILGAEAELFRDWVLPLIPADRAKDTVLFRPADPACSLTWNPLSLEDGEDQALAAGELFTIFKQAIGETTIGARADAILSAAFGVLVGLKNATLWSVIRLMEDEAYRATVVACCDDPYLKEFWTRTFPEYPTGAALPLANRLHQFLRLPQLRAALCHPISSFSIRDALAGSRILLFDLSGLDPDATRLVGQILLSKFQVELMRRERLPEDQRPSVHVHVDEFHMFATSAEGTWRELLARGRRFALGLHLYTQHQNQLPKNLQQEVFGNVSSVIALNLSAGDAAAVRRELLVPGADGTTKPVPAEAFVSLPIGEGFARLGSGACALRVKFAKPIDRPDVRLGDRIRDVSWKTYAAPPLPSLPQPVPRASAAPGPDQTTAVAEPGGPGRGGAKHKLLQRLARDWGEARGFRATVEDEILGGAGRVDIALVRGDVRIAVEVAVTSTPDQIAASVTKAFAAGFSNVVVLAPGTATLKTTEEQTKAHLDARDRYRVRFLDPDGLRTFLDAEPNAAPEASSAAGYTLKVETQPVPRASFDSRRRTIARLVGAALLRQGWPS